MIILRIFLFFVGVLLVIYGIINLYARIIDEHRKKMDLRQRENQDILKRMNIKEIENFLRQEKLKKFK